MKKITTLLLSMSAVLFAEASKENVSVDEKAKLVKETKVKVSKKKNIKAKVISAPLQPVEPVSDGSCKALQAAKPGLNGFAASLVTGILSINSKVENPDTGFSVSNNNRYKRFGLGLTYYTTKENNVVFGCGLDLLSEFGQKTVDARGTIKVLPVDSVTGNPLGEPIDSPVDMKYTQKRPFTANLHFKLGYAYGNFVPYVTLGIRESYVRHERVVIDKPKAVDKDINFGLAPGAGFMYKIGNFGIGADYSYHKESTFGLEGYADKDDQVKSKGGHAVMMRLSYFF